MKLYKIQLFDYNCAGPTSGVIAVYTEDIEDFTKKYRSLVNDKERIDRFLRSKSGEIVTDYYSNSPELNIVQKIEADIIRQRSKHRTNQKIITYNGFGYKSEYFFSDLTLDIMWVRIKNELLKFVKPYGKGCCNISLFHKEKQYHSIEVYGNPFWINNPDEHLKKLLYSDADVFENANLYSYVWQVADYFKDNDELAKDMRRKWLTKEQIEMTFADLAGDAG